MANLDAKLVDHGSYYDFNIDANGDIETEESFEAAIIASIFVDRRADSSEIVQPELRRGWIGSHNNSYKLGSKIWLYMQTRSIAEDIQGIEFEAVKALQHFIDNNLAVGNNAHVSISGETANLIIEMFRPNNKVDLKSFVLWQNTGA